MAKYYALGDVIRKVRPTEVTDTPLPNTLHYNNLGAVVETYASGTVRTFERSGSITYTRRSKNKAKSRLSNFCAHFSHLMYSGDWRSLPKIHAQDLNPAHVGWSWDTWWDYGTAYSAHVASITAASAALPARGLGKLQAGWDSYAATGFQAVQPDLTKVSVPNFLIDIGQIGDLGADIAPLITRKGAVGALSDIERFSANTAKGKIQSVAKFAAGKRLSYKFGWKPTVGDLTNMIGSVLQLQQRLQEFKDSVGKELSFTKTLEQVSDWKSGTFDLGGSNHYKVKWDGFLIGKVQYHAKYQPQALACIGELDEKIRGFLDSLGFELNPQIVWDAIPFSFVVDWFVGVGDWLSQFKIDALHLPIILVDSSVDYKEEFQVTSKVTINPNGYPTDVTATTQPSGYVTRDTLFHRMPVDPSLTLLKNLGWHNPKGSQWINLVSLATVLGL
ncbi:maturation protein [ssRNA phage Gerhypos.1_37]|uniref:Maturation protein n=2 Tax=Leviviricetes TaxID=2842243 RepID=A0A8S5KZU9_9VIRU|nr:maturation protein [ssRNA phage Gerhypos.1_37]QDH89057.1 MAG: hypothetical protein H1Bulk30192_000001 [Leviviridae sp.]DAD50605.1 TPA_asm: maturation protein [ssRNA phage Gerhypos.1_37]